MCSTWRTPRPCRKRFAERSRLEWRMRRRRRPARACRGLPRRARTACARSRPFGRSGSSGAGAVCGAAVFVSAAAAASAGRRRRPARPTPGARRAGRGGRRLRPRGRPRPAAGPVGPRRPGAWRLGRVAAELDAAPSTPARSRRSGRPSPAATSTRSTSSATPSAPYPGDPLPALRRVAGLPGARYGGVLARRRLGDRLRLAGDAGRGARRARASPGRSRAPGRPTAAGPRASCSPRPRSAPSTS